MSIGSALYNAGAKTRSTILPGLAGVNENGSLPASPFTQLFLVSTLTGGTVDEYDPYAEPTGGTVTTTIYAGIGAYNASPRYREVEHAKINQPRGRCVVLGSLNSAKDTFTRMTATQLQALFSPSTASGDQKSFYFGDTFSKDTIDLADPVIVEEVIPDYYLDAVVVVFRKATTEG